MSRPSRKTALVTGASTGIGEAISRALLAVGMRVHLVGRSSDRLRRAFSGVRGSAEARFVEADLSQPEDIDPIPAAVGDRLNVLVHCAGGYHRGGWADTDDDRSLETLFHVNVRGAFALTKRMLPSLIAARGDVVFMNSSVVESEGARVGEYAATKHALRGLANSLRGEVNPHGVRVLSVYPGRTATPMQELVHQLEGRKYEPQLLLQPSDVAQIVVAAIGLSEMAEVTEIYLRPRRGAS